MGGLPVKDYFAKTWRETLEQKMISLEDTDKGLAAILQEHLDKKD